jgi:hypothetical protein
MPIRRAFSASVALVPDISISPVTNFNQSIATFNAVVNPNGYTTSVKFQYSSNGGFSWTDSGTVSNITAPQTVYFNETGFTSYIGYTVRAVATNQIGTSTSSSTTFTPWIPKTYSKTTSGTDSITIQTVTPTLLATVIPSIYDVLVAGGGGGAGYGGGGAGGYRIPNTVTLNDAIGRTIYISVGGGGANGVSGSASSLSGNFTTITAGGGGAGQFNVTNGLGGSGGDIGTGANSALSGGIGYTNFDKNNNPDPNNYSYGGGAGWGAVGGNGGDILDGPFRGGNGGDGATLRGIAGGAGGRGFGMSAGTAGTGTNGLNWSGPSSGGQAMPFGGDGGAKAGIVRFNYYGPPD